jgi:hypothetical protein
MARDGLSAPVRALVVCGVLGLAVLSLAPALCRAQDDPALAARLAVQTALQQGREQLLRGNFQAAVYTLEAQIARIDGSREYLSTLRDAYRGYIKELRLANKNADADEYLKRLRILDPGAVLDPALARNAAAKEPAPKPQPTARGKIDERAEDPFRPENHKPLAAQSLWKQADTEFDNKHYEAAARLFEQAYQIEPQATAGGMERWAYCKLYRVAQLLNQPAAERPPPADLEREVRVALAMAPRLETAGKDLLGKIRDRGEAPAVAAPAVAVRHLGKQADGTSVSETANFRIVHNQSRELVEKVAQVAEETRTAMYRKWVGEVPAEWQPRCDIVLHANGQDYNRATGKPADWPGHSTIRSDAGRVVGRQIDLRCDAQGLLNGPLPHETTHQVLADQFGGTAVPRWADEGMALLSESRDRIDQHLRLLPRYQQDLQLLTLRQLLNLNDYPERRYLNAFYAESASVVEFLIKLKPDNGPSTFLQFVLEAGRYGPETALKRVYNIQDFNQLEQSWQRYALGKISPAGYAERDH